MKMNPMILCIALSLTSACGTDSGKDDSANDSLLAGDPCTVNGEITAASDDCAHDADTVTEQCDTWGDMASTAGCGDEYYAWLSCANDWTSDPPENVTVGCMDDGTPYQAWNPDEFEDPCADLNAEYLACFQ